MKIYDISADIFHEMPVYKNRAEKRPEISLLRDFSSGDVYETNIKMDMHTGTHVDAPLHIVKNGGTIDNIDLNKVITYCKVLDFTETSDSITTENLKCREIKKGDFLIFKTKNSLAEGFDSKFVYLEKSGAEYLKNIGISGVGIDALGIERDQPGHLSHHLLLEQGIVILEGLRLKDIEEGEYFLIAAPLKIKGVEAAPVRAVLVRFND